MIYFVWNNKNKFYVLGLLILNIPDYSLGADHEQSEQGMPLCS